MFDFQKLTVYQKAKEYCKQTTALIKASNFDRTTNDQLRRASFSIMLNIAEGSSRMSKKDRRHFYVISRGSAFECVAILEYLEEGGEITKEQYKHMYLVLEEVSKMCFALIRSLGEVK